MSDKFVPEFSREIKGWAINYISKNKWRINQWIEMEDLIQDSYVYFLICKDRYPDVETKQHFMSLFQSCIRNHLHDLSYKKEPIFEQTVSLARDGDTELDIIETLVCSNSDDVYLEVLISHAPCEIQRCLKLFSDPFALEELRKPYKQRKPRNRLRKRESFNDRLCRLLDLDPTTVDLPSLIRSYFGVENAP